MINVTVPIYHCGGIFNRLIISIQKLLSVSNIDSIDTFTVVYTGSKQPVEIFSSIYQYYTDCQYVTIHKDSICHEIFSRTKYFSQAQSIIRKNKFQSHVLQTVEYYVNKLNITPDTLGIHIRLTDINTIHLKDYGYISIDDYIKHTRRILQIFNITSIFIASDNYESIDIFKKTFNNCNIVYIDTNYRVDKMDMGEEFTQLQKNHIGDPSCVKDAFVDMLLLSKCGYLLHRVSNVSEVALLYSDTIKYQYSIN